MKKFIALLCVALIFSLLAFTGCSDESFTAREYSSEESVIESVSIDVSDRQIEIGVSDDNQVHIDCFDGKKEYYVITVSENELAVKLVFNKKWTDFIGTKPAAEYRKITVSLPQNLTSLSVNTTNEKINISELTCGSVTLTDNGGEVAFDKLSVGNLLSITAKNGDIKGNISGGWDDFSIACNIKKGKSNLPAEKAGGDKTLKVNCNNGDINIQFLKS